MGHGDDHRRHRAPLVASSPHRLRRGPLRDALEAGSADGRVGLGLAADWGGCAWGARP